MTKLYVGNLPEDAREEEVDAAFAKFGKLESVWMARNPPGFAFVTFEDARDADDAMREMDGREFLGHKVRVELSKAKSRSERDKDEPEVRRSRSRTPPRNRSRSRERGRDRGYERGYDRDRRDRRSRSRSRSRGRRGRPTAIPGYNRGEYRVSLRGLSSRTSWQDLKDFLRKGGEVCYTDVHHDPPIADFLTLDDMERAIRKLDNTEFQGYNVRIERYRGHGGDRGGRKSRSRSRSPRRRSPSRSRSR